MLLYHGANPNLKDKRGNTPIHLAAQFKNAESLSALLDRDAYITKYKKHEPDLNALNFSGKNITRESNRNSGKVCIKRISRQVLVPFTWLFKRAHFRRSSACVMLGVTLMCATEPAAAPCCTWQWSDITWKSSAFYFTRY